MPAACAGSMTRCAACRCSPHQSTAPSPSGAPRPRSTAGRRSGAFRMLWVALHAACCMPRNVLYNVRNTAAERCAESQEHRQLAAPPASHLACIRVAAYCDTRRSQCTRLRAPAAAVRAVRHKDVIGDAARFAPCVTWHAKQHVALLCRQQEIIGDNVDFGDANGTVPRLSIPFDTLSLNGILRHSLCLCSSCPSSHYAYCDGAHGARQGSSARSAARTSARAWTTTSRAGALTLSAYQATPGIDKGS